MINIAICDDEIRVCGELELKLIEIMRKLGLRHEILAFATGMELYEQLKQDQHFDLIFLDIELAEDDENGVVYSRLIREKLENVLTSICFISWQKKYTQDLFDSQPLNFLEKPLTTAKIEKVITQFLRLLPVRDQNFTYKIGHDILKKPLKSITFFESQRRKIMIHTTDNTNVAFYGSLPQTYVQQLQNHDFLFIHQSYVVNYDAVARFGYDELMLFDGRVLKIAQDRRAEISRRQQMIEQKRGIF